MGGAGGEGARGKKGTGGCHACDASLDHRGSDPPAYTRTRTQARSHTRITPNVQALIAKRTHAPAPATQTCAAARLRSLRRSAAGRSPMDLGTRAAASAKWESGARSRTARWHAPARPVLAAPQVGEGLVGEGLVGEGLVGEGQVGEGLVGHAGRTGEAGDGGGGADPLGEQRRELLRGRCRLAEPLQCRGTHRLLTGYSQGTHRVLTGHSQGTHRALTGYSQGTHRVLTGYSRAGAL